MCYDTAETYRAEGTLCQTQTVSATGLELKDPLIPSPVCIHEATNAIPTTNLARTGKLGNSLGSLGYSVLGKFSRQHETHSSLNFPTAQSGLFAKSSQSSCFSSNTIKDIIDKRVHNGHSLLGNSSIRVDLLEHTVNVRRPRFDSLLVALASRRLLGCLLGGLLGWCLGHFDVCDV